MQNVEKIGFLESIALITIVITNKIILNIPKDIISDVGSSSWLNVLYISIIAAFIAFFIGFLFKHFQGQDILDICNFLGGPTLKIIMGILYIILLLFVPIFVVKYFAETLKVIYFKTSPLIYIMLFFIVSSAIANRFSLKVLAKVNLLIIPVVFLSIIVILLSSIKSFIPERIFPILGNGINETFFSGLTNLFSFSGIGYLFFLSPFIDKSKDLKKISVISIIISGIYLLLSVTSILLSLSYTFNSGESFSLYLLTRNLEYGRFIQRIDAVFILIWIISTISYASIATYFGIYIFKKLTNISDTRYINFTFHLALLAILIIPANFAIFAHFVGTISKIGTLILLFGISIFILILANIKIALINKKKNLNTTVTMTKQT